MRSSPGKTWWQSNRAQVLMVALALAVVRFWPFFLGQTIYFGDNYSLQVPGKIFTANWMKQGILPLWNPTIFAGIPWISEINQSVLYPTSFLFVVFDPAIALNISLFLHLGFTFMGAYWLARAMKLKHDQALLAGILWAYSTQVTGSLNNMSTIQSLAWLPWVVYAGVKLNQRGKAWFWFGLSVTWMFLGGYPQHVILAIVTAVIFSNAVRSGGTSFGDWLSKWMKTAVIVGLLSAVAWLPFAQALLESTRVEQSIEQAQSGSLKPVMMLKALAPYIFDMPRVGMKWGPAWSGQPNMFLYVSVFGLSLMGAGILSKKIKGYEWLWAIIIGLGIVLSWGEYLPGYELIQRSVPIFRWGRYPSMMMIVVNLATALLVASLYGRIRIPKRVLSWVLGLGGAGAVLGLGLFWAVRSSPEQWWLLMDQWLGGKLANSPFHTPTRDAVIGQVVGMEMIIISILTAATVWLYRLKKYRAVVMLIGIDLLVHTQGNLFFADNNVYRAPKNGVVAALGGTVPEYRLITRNMNAAYTDYGMYWEAMVVRSPFSDSFIDEQELKEQHKLIRLKEGLTPNWNMTVGIPVVNGYTALLPSDYAGLWDMGRETRINFLPYIEPNGELARQWSVGYYLVDTQFNLYDEVLPETVVGEEDGLVLYRLDGAWPRFRYESGEALSLTSYREGPNRVELAFVNDGQEKKAIMADRFDEDWQMMVNGQKVKLENYQGMRRFAIRPGSNEVVMQYWPKSFLIAIGLTLSGLMGCWWYNKDNSIFKPSNRRI